MSGGPLGVLLMAYGGPDSLDDIKPYLLDVRGGRATSPELVAEICERYAHIGGRSPLLEITRAQAAALEKALRETAGDTRLAGARVYVGMRHWRPYIADVVAEMARDGIRRGVAICMAPHYSRMSIGAYLRKLNEAVAGLATPIEFAAVESWHNHPLFIQALAERLEAALARHYPGQEDVQVIFTAHSLPAAIVQQGDPYEQQLAETAALVAARACLSQHLPSGAWRFCYQSAAAQNGKWLGPVVEDVIVELADAGHRNLLVAPIGFLADHVEILFDIDVECRETAEAHGAHLERTESLNDSPRLAAALAEVAQGAIETL